MAFNVSYLGGDPNDPMGNLMAPDPNDPAYAPSPFTLAPGPRPVSFAPPMIPQDPGQNIPALPPGNLPPAPAYQPGINAPDDPDSAARRSMNQLGAAYASRPELTPPKWWQRVAGGVAGGLAGWSNASGHRQPPVDIGAMEQNILHPGQAEKMAEWQQNTLAPAQAQAEIAGGQQAAWWKSQQILAQTEMEKQHGAYWQQRAQMEQNQWKIDPKSGAIYNTITGERGASAAPTPQDRYNISKALGGSDDEARYYGENGNLSGYSGTLQKDIPEKPTIVPPGATLWNPITKKPDYVSPRQFDPGTDAQPNTKAFTAATTRQSTRNLQAEGAARSAIARGEDPTEVYAGLASTKQNIENDFENEVNAAGGSAKHVEYGQPPPQKTAGAPSTTTPPPSQKTVAPAAPSQYTEAQVRTAAIAKNKDPDAAVQMARQRKLIP